MIIFFETEQARKNGLKWKITTVFTFDGSPLCFSAQQPPPVDLILLVTAHHSKRDHLLFNGGGAETTVTPRVWARTRFWATVGRERHKYLSAAEPERDPHPDLIVDHPVLGVLVKLLLRVHVDAVGSQLFPDLEDKIQTLKPAPSTVAGKGSALRSSLSGATMQLVTVVRGDGALHAEQTTVVLMLISPLIYAKSLGLFINSPLRAATRETLAWWGPKRTPARHT